MAAPTAKHKVRGGRTLAPLFSGRVSVGLLRVTSNPALPTQISVNGAIADSWGLNWLEMPPRHLHRMLRPGGGLHRPGLPDERDGHRRDQAYPDRDVSIEARAGLRDASSPIHPEAHQ
jgi:hypothetical protein